MRNSFFILGCLGIGLFLPALGDYTAVIRPFLMLLLFLAFLRVRLSRTLFRREHLYAALLLPLGAGLAYQLGALYDRELAVNLLVIALAPTAVITPVLVDLARGKVTYAIGGILVTHLAWALYLPLLLPFVADARPSIPALLGLFWTVGVTVGLPLLLAQTVRRWGSGALPFFDRVGKYGIYLFLINVTIAAGRLSQYLRYEAAVSLTFLLLVAAGVVLVGGLLFAVGSRVCPPGLTLEGSLVLGRKNTMLSIWMALTFLSPLAIIAPMLYILFQNVLFAGQLGYRARKARLGGLTGPPPV